jgi:hypothetical protein
MDNGHFVTSSADFRDVGAGLPNDLQLRFGGRGSISGLQGVAAQSDNDSFRHRISIPFQMFILSFPQKLLYIQVQKT